MELYKVFLQMNVVFLLIAFCVSQTESSTKPATSAEFKQPEPREQKEPGDIRTTTRPQSDFYTALPIFPSDETKYSTNETLIRQLLKLNEKNSEVDDLLQRERDNSNLQYTERQESDEQFYVTANNIRVENTDETNENRNVLDKNIDVENTEDDDIPKLETQWIEDGENTEDDRSNISVEVINETVNSSTVHYTIKTDYIGIFAGFFIIVGVIVYLAVSAWRRMVKQRYKHREMLVNEEFYDPSDMKYFSI